MLKMARRENSGYLHQWAVVDDNEVYWADSFEEADAEFPTSYKFGVIRQDLESPVIVMSNAETLTLHCTPLNESVILFHNLLCDRETAREE